MNLNKALDILDKWEFFYGQRAGRELWFGKPKEVQDKDIADFVRDVNFIRSVICQLCDEQGVVIFMRLIDVDRLVKDYCSDCPLDVQNRCETDPICGILMYIFDAPTVDAEPVRHGKWEPFDYEYGGIPDIGYVCSECGRSEGFPEPYCHCGAKMDGE